MACIGFLKKGGAQCTEIAFNANTICLLSANVSGTVGGSEFGRQVWHTQKSLNFFFAKLRERTNGIRLLLAGFPLAPIV